MKKHRKFGLLFVLLMTSVSIFAGGIALSGVGTRALSMGGAYRGLADDASAMYWNPAGLSLIKNKTAVLSTAIIIPKGEYTTLLNPTEASGIKTDKQETVDKTWAFPNLYYVNGGECKFNWGIGIFVPYGLGAEWDIYNYPDTFLSQSTTWPSDAIKNEMFSSISIIDFHPTMSYQVSDQFSFGAGLSVLYGDIEIKKYAPLKVTSATSIIPPTLLSLTGTGYTVSGNMGGLYKVCDKLQIGLTGKLPGKMTLKGDADLKLYLNDMMTGLGSPMTLTNKYDAEATLNLPADAGLGVSYHVNENWLVTADMSWTGWSCFDKITIELDSTSIQKPIPNMDKKELDTKWKDTFRVSFGTEYMLSNNIALRGGFFYDQSPIPDESLNPTWPDVNDKFSYNLGIGLPFMKHFNFDFAYEYIYFPEREIKEQTSATDGSMENMKGTYKTTINALNMSLVYRF